jgi:hypothetical protein
MAINSLPINQGNQRLIKSARKQVDVQIAQERVYSFLMGIVKRWSPEDVLREFKRLFIDCLDSAGSDSTVGIYSIFLKNNEQDFRNTLKRCCYILVNNWETSRKYKYIQELVNIFASYQPSSKTTVLQEIKIYRSWLENFINSKDYQELKLFAYKYEDQGTSHWVNRYTSYLLLAQSVDKNNPKEQQEAAKKLSKHLKDKFKFQLAMYIARSQSYSSSANRYKNPTVLGDNVIRLIKAIVVKKGVFSYENIANIFLRQTQNQNLKDFKESLQKYLIFSVEQQQIVETIKEQLSDKLSTWKIEYDETIISKEFLLRICNQVIDCLTTENRKEPSPLFILLLSQGHPLTLVIVLLKIILICKHSRNHLEMRIADLIRYYDQYPEDECQWVINFIEIFNITFAIYAENVEYNLIKMKDEETPEQKINLDSYRVFSQIKLNGKK